MRSITTLFTLLFTVISLAAQKPLEGVWQTGRDNTLVEIKLLDNEWVGQIISSDNPKAVKGTQIISNLQKKKAGYAGKLYVIKYDQWVDAYFEPKENHLSITVSSGFRSKTIKWTKEK